MITQKEIEDQLQSLMVIKNRCINKEHYFAIEKAINILKWVIGDEVEKSPTEEIELLGKKIIEREYVNSLNNFSL